MRYQLWEKSRKVVKFFPAALLGWEGALMGWAGALMGDAGALMGREGP